MTDDQKPGPLPPALQPTGSGLPVFLVRGGDRLPVEGRIGRQF